MKLREAHVRSLLVARVQMQPSTYSHSIKEKPMKYPGKLIAVAFATLLSPAAFADAASVRVDYSDLNLSNPAGQRALDTRISRAARSVCGDNNGVMSLRETSLIKTCIANAREQAAAAVKVHGSIELVSR
jgi:UrcA family protein